VVHGTLEFDKLAPPDVPVMPDWSPVVNVPGHWKPTSPLTAQVHQCVGPCGVHAYSHERARLSSVPVKINGYFYFTLTESLAYLYRYHPGNQLRKV
jgi:hypothetical protein